MAKRQSISVIGVPMDLGTRLRGVDMGPSAIRVAGLNEKLADLGYRVRDLGNLSVPHASVALPDDTPLPRRKLRELQFAPPIARVCRELNQVVRSVLDKDCLPLVLGGDHSIAMGTVGGVAQYGRKHGKNFGLLWVDAHGDCNTLETTPSGNIHGMPLAVILGHGAKQLRQVAGRMPLIAPQRTVLLGARDLDVGERENIKRFGIHVITMRQIDEFGISVCMREALSIVSENTDGFHLSFDIDSVDPDGAPGVGTPVPGGLTVREAHLIMELVADTKKMISLELVEVNPAMDHQNRTGRLAAELILSAFGAAIL